MATSTPMCFEISSQNWAQELSSALMLYAPDDVIVVDSDFRCELAHRAARRMGKTVRVEVDMLLTAVAKGGAG